MRRGQVQRLGLQRLGRHEPVVEAPALALLGAHRAPGVEQFGRPALADDARQDGAGAHVAAGKADAREQEGRLGRRRREPDVGGHGDDRARPHRHAVDGRDDRLAAVQHRLDEIARHAREGEQLLHVHGDQRADDVVHIAARAEIAAIGQEHDRMHVVLVDQLRGTCRAARHRIRRSAGSCARAGRGGSWRCRRIRSRGRSSASIAHRHRALPAPLPTVDNLASRPRHFKQETLGLK